MIRKVRVIHREIDTWAGGSVFEGSLNGPFQPDTVMFEQEYPRGTPTAKVWDDLRERMLVSFFGIFHPHVVEVTKPESRHVANRRAKNPDLYEWVPDERKWAMSEEGYMSSVIFGKDNAGPIPTVDDVNAEMDIGVAESAIGEMQDIDLVDRLQEENRGQTHSIVLFVYPDRYDERVRAIFELELTHW